MFQMFWTYGDMSGRGAFLLCFFFKWRFIAFSLISNPYLVQTSNSPKAQSYIHNFCNLWNKIILYFLSYIICISTTPPNGFLKFVIFLIFYCPRLYEVWWFLLMPSFVTCSCSWLADMYLIWLNRDHNCIGNLGVLLILVGQMLNSCYIEIN